jgi:hypothetical protein
LNNSSEDDDSEFKNKPTYVPPHPKAPPKIEMPKKDDKSKLIDKFTKKVTNDEDNHDSEDKKSESVDKNTDSEDKKDDDSEDKKDDKTNLIDKFTEEKVKEVEDKKDVKSKKKPTSFLDNT